MSLAKEYLFHFSGISYNILFTAYIVLTKSFITKGLTSRGEGNITSPILGILIFFISLGEAPALHIKLRRIFSRDHHTRLTPNRSLMFMGPIFFRTLIGLILAVAMAYLLSPDLKARTFSNYVVLAMAGILFLKEIYILFSTLIFLRRPQLSNVSVYIERICDIVLLSYACITYTVLTYPGFFLSQRTTASLTGLFLIGILFILGFSSIRIAYLLEEFVSIENWRQGLFLIMTFFLTVYFGITTFIQS